MVVMRSGQSGFIFPFALMLLVVFSILISMMAGHIEDAQKRARHVSQQALYTLGGLSLEQEIIFRAIVEYYTKRYSGGLVNKKNSENYTYQNILPPQNSWKLKAEEYTWGGMYAQHHPLPEYARNLKVSIQDNAGLFDVNYILPKYLEYVATLVGVEEGEEKRAVDTLMDYVDPDSTPRLRGHENIRYDNGGYPANSRLRSTSEICGLPVWQNIELCLDRARLHSLLVAGHGGAPAFYAMSADVVALLVPDSKDKSDAEKLKAWENTQKTNGFYNKNYGLNGAGLDLTVTISQPKSAIRKRFRVIIHSLEDQRPYTIIDEAFEYVPLETTSDHKAQDDSNGNNNESGQQSPDRWAVAQQIVEDRR